MNIFGGDWTAKKIEIVVKYTKAYLTIMNKHKGLKTIYFDGFAGSGEIKSKNSKTILEGVASQIININEPCSFDIYYLVELDKNKVESLRSTLKQKYPAKIKNIHITADDCNRKLIDLATFLNKNPYYRALAFVDPQGMQVKWNSMEIFSKVNVDMWILIPTGIGVNRMLTKTGDISAGWMSKLIDFLGLDEKTIRILFYKETEDLTLFGKDTIISKYDKSVERIIEIYSGQLKNIWKYVSEPYPIKNSTGSLMFHLILASQNPYAQKIANDIIRKS